MLVGGQRTELLTLGEAREGRIAKFGLARYSVMHDDPKANLFLFLESKDGDADIFVSRGDENPPTSTEYTWASAAMGSDEVLIRLDDPKFWTGAYQIAVYGGGGQKERVSFEIIARAYQPIGGIDARLYAPYSHSEAHTQGKRFLREVRQADFRRHRVKLGQPAADIMARRENPEPSTAPPTPTRRLLALEELRISNNNLEEMPKLNAQGHKSLTVFEIHKNRVATVSSPHLIPSHLISSHLI